MTTHLSVNFAAQPLNERAMAGKCKEMNKIRDNSKDKTEVLEFGKCPVRLIKHYVAQWSEEDVWYNLRDISEIVRKSRYSGR